VDDGENAQGAAGAGGRGAPDRRRRCCLGTVFDSADGQRRADRIVRVIDCTLQDPAAPVACRSGAVRCSMRWRACGASAAEAVSIRTAPGAGRATSTCAIAANRCIRSISRHRCCVRERYCA